ncbi:MAG: hypothetical protein QNJ38_01205 [Prochloraceae cyanobacterium]|nr:hypothetical protein [Prochloraceae cyanobacterium]
MIRETFEISLSSTLVDRGSKKPKSFTYRYRQYYCPSCQTLPEQKPED